MGSANNKCSCFNSKEDNETAKLDKSEQNNQNDSNKNSYVKGSNPDQVTLKNLKSYVTFKNMDNSPSQAAEDSISVNNNILFDSSSKENKKHTSVLVFQGDNNTNDKSQTNSPEKGIFIFGLKQHLISLESRKSSKSDKESEEEKVITFSKRNIFDNKSNEEEKNNNNDRLYNPLLVICIQKYFNGYFYRKRKFPKIKQKLLLKLEEQVKDLYNEYLTSNLKKQEESLGINHSETSYKSLYSNSSSIGIGSALVGGLRLYTKLLILKYKNIPSFYVGEVNMNNELSGRGILMQKDGSKYNGTFENNIFTGVGRYIDKEGTLYEGYFKNGKLDGRATKKMLNGSLYIGDFVNGVREGRGKEETNEHVYEGQFSKDNKNGKGKLIYKLLNDSYEGDFVDNLITGVGTYRWTNGETYVGSFVGGKMHGKGIYRWPDGGVYEGEYTNNIKEGKGVFKWANGKVFEGEFKNGKPSGPGILTVRERKYKVIFKDGKLEGKLEDLSRRGQRIDEEDESEEEEDDDVQKIRKKKQKKRTKNIIQEEDEKHITEEDEDSQSYSQKRTISKVETEGKKKNRQIFEFDSNMSDSFNRENSYGSKNKKRRKEKKDISMSIDESKDEESEQSSSPKKKKSLSKNKHSKKLTMK